jgi:hypothetical protein
MMTPGAFNPTMTTAVGLAATLALVGACGASSGPTVRTVNHCPKLPARPTGVMIELSYHDGSEPLHGVSVQMVDGTCPKDAWRRALLPDEDVRCFDVGAVGINAAIAALRRAGVTGFHVTEVSEQDVSPHRGGWSVTATWPGGTCAFADSWIWEMAPLDAVRFEALRAELGRIRGARISRY